MRYPKDPRYIVGAIIFIILAAMGLIYLYSYMTAKSEEQAYKKEMLPLCLERAVNMYGPGSDNYGPGSFQYVESAKRDCERLFGN